MLSELEQVLLYHGFSPAVAFPLVRKQDRAIRPAPVVALTAVTHTDAATYGVTRGTLTMWAAAGWA